MRRGDATRLAHLYQRDPLRVLFPAPEIAAAGVDLISSGWITHSAPILDLGLDID